MTTPRSMALNRCLAAALAASLGLGLALPAAAQWKWRDKNGSTQYSDLPPPPGTPAKDILQRPGNASFQATAAVPASSASAAPLSAARASDPELEAKRKQAAQDALDKKKAEDAKGAAIRAENCSRAQEQKRTFDSGVRITRTAPNGEREFLDDSQRAAEAAKTQQAIAADCR